MNSSLKSENYYEKERTTIHRVTDNNKGNVHWYLAYDTDGTPYFHNQVSGVNTYDKPNEFHSLGGDLINEIPMNESYVSLKDDSNEITPRNSASTVKSTSNLISYLSDANAKDVDEIYEENLA